MQNQEVENLFSTRTEIKEDNFSESVFYSPKPKDAPNNIYKAKLRFVPWYKDVTKNMNSKWSVRLGTGQYVDCPSTLGEKSIFTEALFYCKDHAVQSVRDRHNQFKRRRSIASIVQIVEDKNKPELEGKLMIWRYGIKVLDKIRVLNDEDLNPFHPVDGQIFNLHVKEVNNYPNYDLSNFSGKSRSLIDGNREEIYNYVKDNSPDLDQCSYKPWDDATKRLVEATVGLIPGFRGNPMDADKGGNLSGGDQQKIVADSTDSAEDLLDKIPF